MIPFLAIVAIGALAAALALATRLRRERALRLQTEVRVRALEEEEQRAAATRRRMVSVAAHELRSPVSVILGYHELIADGIYGQLDQRGQEALTRIRQAAEHQLRVLEGTVDLIIPAPVAPDAIAPVDLRRLARDALEDGRSFGQAYSVEIDSDDIDELPTVMADAQRLRRALDMVFAAAVKGSPGRHIRFHAGTADDDAVLALGDTGLDPVRDEPGGLNGQPLRIETGAALRIAIARSILNGTGTVRVLGPADASTIELRLDAGTADPVQPTDVRRPPNAAGRPPAPRSD